MACGAAARRGGCVLGTAQIQDLHRNALVSIFLRVLEYFQGVLFLTTNRVETFDEAFQSRIHVALRYGDLSVRAKRSVWKMFLDRVGEKEGVQIWGCFTDKDLEALSRRAINGRQVCMLPLPPPFLCMMFVCSNAD